MLHPVLRVSFLASAFALLAACPSGSDQRPDDGSIGGTDSVTASGGTADTTAGDAGSDVCLLHNCNADAECGGCTEGRNSCYAADKRCVACNPDTGDGCADGEECTEFGYCVPAGTVCPVDANGEQTDPCTDDPDCAACGPDNQVCAAGACVACRGDATDACLGNEQCIDNTCAPNCPQECEADADCAACGANTQQPATACHNHRCAECSDSQPCPAGEDCSNEGACVPVCGLPGMVVGVCDQDADCAGCLGDNTNCNTPINGGHGTCGPTASGCSDLGNGVVVLPDPFDQVTNLCSDDGDCSGVGVEYNVGALLRDITGLEGIGDANIQYPMNACAAVTVGVGDSSISCGVCVPCRTHDDCMDIDVDMVAEDAFGPLGAIAAALLLDQLFGADDPLIYMFCQPVAGEYGVCAPCPSLVNDCAGGGGGGGSGTCDHDVCTEGGPLDPSCGTCAAAVCNADSFCCNNTWDGMCVAQVEDQCAGGCSGGGGDTCHDQCEVGVAMAPSCNGCVSAICAIDPFCCQSSWDDLCVGLVANTCDGECSGGGCAHSECSQGGPLQIDCSSCATTVCDADAFCCNIDWDAACVTEAEALCGGQCTGGGCAHDECQQGGPLDATCSACADAVCDQDPFCCSTTWDDVCVDVADAAPACPNCF